MRPRIKTIVVRACRNADDYERGWDVEDTHLETIREAKARARYYLTDTFKDRCETSERLMYSQVVVNDEVLYDYFG